MSSQKGNTKRSRAQKYQNSSAFKNSLHDTSKRTKEINSIEVTDCCPRCTEVIEWKIKYKKYKLLTVPKKCVRCLQKTVKQAYTIVCSPCAQKLKVCAKCNGEKSVVQQGGPSAAEEASQAAQFDQELKMLPERKRRTFLRLQAEGKFDENAGRGKDEVESSDSEISDDEEPDEEEAKDDPGIAPSCS